MVAEVVARIVSVVQDEEDGGTVVHFWVGRELADRPSLNEAFALLSSMDSLQRETFAMVVRFEDGEYTMEPDDNLAECLIVHDEHPSPEGLDDTLARKWKTGEVGEQIVGQLVAANLFGVWRTGEAAAAEAGQEAGDGSGAEVAEGVQEAGETSDDDTGPEVETEV